MTTVTAIAAVPSTGALDAGKTVTFTLSLSGAVQVTGHPTLSLSDGSVASYVAASSTSTSLVFAYTVAAGDNSVDLQVAGLVLNGASITAPGVFSIGAATNYAAGTNPVFVTTTDVNKDGKPDLVVADIGGKTVSVLLGNGSGGFGTPTTYAVGTQPTSLTMVDVNGDGRLDIVVANAGDSAVSVLLGNSSGGFGLATTYAAGAHPYTVTTADVNGDGKPDAIVSNYLSGTVSVLLGNGTGGFGTPTSYAVGSEPYVVTTADLNGDGKPDLIAANYYDGTVSVLLNNGSGGFGTATTYAAGPNPYVMTTADLNGDGKLDLIVADLGGGVSVLLGNGSGGFGTATTYAPGSASTSVATADANGDGKLDLIVADPGGNVSVLLGDGNGGFGTATTYAAGSTPYSVTAADVNGDGKPDLVVADYGGGVSVLLNTSTGGALDAASVATASGHDTGLVIDTTAPLAPALPTLAAASDTGISHSDGITSVRTPTLTGTAEAGSTVRLYDTNGTTLLGSAIATGGSYSITSTTLGEGSHTLSVKATDIAGNTSTASAALTVTIDTTAPVAPVLSTLATASDTGISHSDGITSVTTPTLTGVAEAGSTVTITDSSGAHPVILGTAVAGTSGQWSFVPSIALGEGAHSLTDTATDAAGNVSPVSNAFSLTIDSIAPVAPTSLALAPGSDSGIVGDNITNVAFPTLTGAAEAGSLITLTDTQGGTTTTLGTTTADANGNWSFTATAMGLREGTQSVAATATDAAGNVSAPSAIAVTFELFIEAPTLAVAPASDSDIWGDRITNDSSPTLFGTAEAGSTVKLTDISSVNPVMLGSVVADASGNWAFTPVSPLPDATYVVFATATDVAGNASPPANMTLTIDTKPPAAPAGLSLASDSGVLGDGITNVATPTLTGTAEAGSLVTLTDSSGATPVLLGTTVTNASGAWSFVPTTALAQGGHSLAATATDIAGNVSIVSQSFALTIDTTSPLAPALPTLAAASDTGISHSDGITSVTTPTLTGTAEAGSTVTLYDTDGTTVLGTTIATGGSYSITSTALGEGSHTLSVKATDIAGNTSTASPVLTVTIDITAPVTPALPTLAAASDTGVSHSDDITSVRTPTLTGTAEAGSTVRLYDTNGTTLLGSAIATGGSYSITSTTLGEGSHTFSVKATDLAGNTSTASSGLVVAIDTAVPVVSSPALTVAENAAATAIGITAPTDNKATGDQMVITAAGLPADGTVTLADGVTAVTVGQVLTTAELTGLLFTPTAGLFGQSADFTYTVADPAGNSSTGTATLQIALAVVTIYDGARFLALTAETTSLTLGSGNDTITAAAGGKLTVAGGSGQFLFANDTGTSIVTGGTGTATIFGGLGGGDYTGGSAGQNILVSQGAAGTSTTMTGAAAGDQLFGSAEGNDILVAAQGREFVLGGGGNTTIEGGNAGSVIFTGSGVTTVLDGASGGDTVVGGAGSLAVTAQGGDAIFGNAGALSVAGSSSGSDSIVGGTGGLVVTGHGGNMLVVAGSSTAQIQTGDGSSLIFAGAANTTLTGGAGSMEVLLGTGSIQVQEGTGAASYDVVKGSAGGTAVLDGFRAGTDRISLFGYGSSDPTVTQGAGYTLVSLSDGTRIQLMGVGDPGHSIIG